MGFLPCDDQQDPFTRKVRELYRANVVKAPRTGIDPLDGLAIRKTVVDQRGRLSAMLDGQSPALPQAESTDVVALQGEHSSTINVGLGLELTGTFFAALGVPIPSAKATASLWQGAQKIQFEVRDVVQHQIDVAELGRVLTGRRVLRNAATDVFFTDQKTRLLIITRTLTTPTFAVHATGSSGQSIAVDVDGVKEIIGAAKAEISWTVENSSSVSFRGKVPATFAFACVPCAIAVDGTFVFGLETAEARFGQGPATQPEMQPVIDRAGLLTID